MSTFPVKGEVFTIENITNYLGTKMAVEMLGELVLLSEEKEAESNFGYTDLIAQ
jgi:hypothetical protein